MLPLAETFIVWLTMTGTLKVFAHARQSSSPAAFVAE
jgi:hypothetical protein